MYRNGKNIGKLFHRLIIVLVVGLISFYQIILSPIFSILLGAKCRYPVSCSVYAKEKIKRYGILKGGYMGLMRLLSCQPFARIQQQ